MQQVIRTLTDSQRLALAERLVTLTTDATEASFLDKVYVHPMQVEPLLAELETRGWIGRDHARGRVVPGSELLKERPAQPHEERRLEMLQASEVGRKVLALDTKTPGPKPGLTAARRAALLGASAGGRALLANDKAKKQGA